MLTMKIRIHTCFCIALLLITSCRQEKQEQITRKPDTPVETKPNYMILPHMKGEIKTGQNYIYCPTFQMAWQDVQTNIFKEPIQLDGDPEIARILNETTYNSNNLESGTYFVRSGFKTNNIIEETRNEFIQKFGENPDVLQYLEDRPLIAPNDLFAFAYLEAILGFREPFYVFTYPLNFQSKNAATEVTSFGVPDFPTEDHFRNDLRREQIKVNSYLNGDDFILTLYANYMSGEEGNKPEDKEISEIPDETEFTPSPYFKPSERTHEIIIAKISPSKTLEQTWQSVLGRLHSNDESFEIKMKEDDLFKIPKVNFKKTRTYNEIIGKGILNKGFNSLLVTEALQFIDFTFNEKGAILKSFGLMACEGFMEIRHPRRFICDKPFLLALRRPGKEPYLVLWLENPDFFSEWQKPKGEYRDAFKLGQQEAKKRSKNRQLTWMVRDISETMPKIVLEEIFHINVSKPANNFTGEELSSYVDGYNKTMAPALRDKHGADFFQQLDHYVKKYSRRISRGAAFRGLFWLKDEQNEDGTWGDSSETKLALTSLAVLNYLAHGETPASEEFGLTSEKALKKLIKMAQKENIPDDKIHSHLIMTTALLEAHNLTHIPIVTEAAKKKLVELLEAETVENFWYLLALRSAENTIFFEKEVKAKIELVVAESKKNQDKYIKSGNIDGAYFCILAQLLFPSGPLDEQAMNFLSQKTSFNWGDADQDWQLQRWYSETLVRFFTGGDIWMDWNKTFAPTLVKACSIHGSWEYPGSKRTTELNMFKDNDSHTYSTVMANSMLMVYYRYLTYLQKEITFNDVDASSIKIEIENI
ncbi:hypothetical protein ACFLS1_08505 [Verrucomicrobiota bacterium]